MWWLAVDTSGREGSLALLQEERRVALAASPAEEHHSLWLFRILERVLEEAGVKLSDLGAYAVATGPGAFTGLRVGLAAVKALAEMQGKPVVPVSVLEAVCESAQAEGLLVPLLDAYRGQVFAGVYQKHSKGVELRRAETVEQLSDWLAELERGGYGSEPLTFVGPHLERWKDALAASSFAAAPQERTSTLLAEAVARRARWKWSRGQAVDALHLRANYVRPSDAELLWKEK